MVCRNVCAVLLGLIVVLQGAAAAAARQKIPLNDNWSFAFGPAVAGQGENTAWERVTLPHTWNAADSSDKTRTYRRGQGRYRKSLFLDPALSGKRLYLYFEGANQVAEVSVNGAMAGRHVGGYTAFAMDVTDLVRLGERNEIAVRVDNSHDGDVPPLNADFTFYGGIYRDVWLLVLEDVHFALDEHAATDVRIRTPALTARRAQVAIDAGLANDSGAPRFVEAEFELRNADGTVVALETVTAAIDPHSAMRMPLATLRIDEPNLWTPESPYLYRVVATVREDGRVLDQLAYPLGLRWFDVDPQTGFRLNGKPYRLFGTNRHQDRAGLGNALTDGLHRHDLQTIRNNGFNFLRLAHYPQDPAVLDAADELGLIVWEEIPIVNRIGTTAAFRANSTRMLREMIRQHRHHPSILFWGYMNEVMLQVPEPLPDGYYEEIVSLARHLENVAGEEDAARLTAMALSYDEIYNGVPIATIPDVLGLNLYFGWYYGEFGDLGAFLDRLHRERPALPLIVSEYGAGSDERVHAADPQRFDFSIEYQQRFHEETFRQILDRPWLVGSAVWNQFDFGSNHRQDTRFAINQKGLWTFDRSPRDIAWFYRAQLGGERMLHIAARDWQRRAGSRDGDAAMPLRVYGNTGRAELFLNGRSLGMRELENAGAAWDVRFVPGDNLLVARGPGVEDRLTIRYEDRSGLFDGSGAASVAVNAGGAVQYVDPAGGVWEADRRYRQGSWGYLGGDSERSHHRIFNTADDPLYQSRRRGVHEYRFDVPDGAYLLQLHFAQLDEAPDELNARIDINGKALPMPSLAPFVRHALDALIVAAAGEGVRLRFSAAAGEPYVNGIVLRPVGRAQE